MRKESIASLGVALVNESTPVLVRGFRRDFSQEPSWRKGIGRERAVLNAVESRQDLFNGIMVRGITGHAWQTLDQRESGYRRVAVPWSFIAPFEQAALGNEGEVYFYCGRDEKRNSDLLPNPTYLAACIGGAQDWGHSFFRCFLRTTFVGSRTLADLTESSDEEQWKPQASLGREG